LAKAIIELVAETRLSVSDADQDINLSERQEIETLKQRREVRTFTGLNIPMGAELTFAKDQNINCRVHDSRKVEFRGQILSPSAAALIAVREMGYDWSAVSGMDYWQYRGTKLANIREETSTEELGAGELPPAFGT